MINFAACGQEVCYLDIWHEFVHLFLYVWSIELFQLHEFQKLHRLKIYLASVAFGVHTFALMMHKLCFWQIENVHFQF